MHRHISLLIAMLLAGVGLLSVPGNARAEQTVYVIPVEGMIERGLLYSMRRGMEEARRQGASAVILDMDTPGGKLESAEEIVLLLLNAPMPTYTFVNPRAISAGAIISLATDGIYMTPHALIGDAMPILMSPLPMGGAQAVPDDLKEKVMSPTIALARSAAQAKGHDPQLAEAMIRPEMEYAIGDRVICPAGQLLTLTTTDALEPLREDGKPLLAAGTANNLDELLELLDLGQARVVTVTITLAERIARVIEGFPMSGILMALGLLGLYIEIKTPGFGVPGIAGIICLALWFWGHHIAGLSGMFEMLLFTVGVILILTEIFLLPGFGVTGITGLICLVIAILMSMVSPTPAPPPGVPVPALPPLNFPDMQWRHGVYNLSMALVSTFLAALLLARVLPRHSIFRRIILETEVSRAGGYQAVAERPSLVGQVGVSATPLRPSGLGDFNGERLSVVARGAFVDSGVPIVIAEAHGNRIIVDAAPPQNT